jgi:hypothetical protein
VLWIGVDDGIYACFDQHLLPRGFGNRHPRRLSNPVDNLGRGAGGGEELNQPSHYQFGESQFRRRWQVWGSDKPLRAGYRKNA